MGKLQRIHKKKRHRKQKRVTLEGRTEVLESEPELSRLGTESSSRDGEDSSISLPASPTSLSLALSSSFRFEEACVRGKATNRPEEATIETESLGPLEEMEVTRKMSTLTFAKGARLYRDQVGLPEASCYEAGLNSMMREQLEEGLSETELCSELASATQLDLLPTLSDRELGQECVNELEMAQRRARKRPSRRKPTRKTKKQRSVFIIPGVSHDRSVSPKVTRGFLSSSVPSLHHPLAQNFVRTSSKENPSTVTSSAVSENISKRFSRARSFRRTRRSKVEEDPLFCFLSDTSVAPDADGPSLPGSFTNSHDMEWVEPYSKATPHEVEEEEMEEVMPNESDFTDSTSSSSGCDGDDEESSVEGPNKSLLMCGGTSYQSLPAPPSLDVTGPMQYPAQWAVDDNSDDTFQHILEGSLPLLTPESRYRVEQICGLDMEVDCGSEGKRRVRVSDCCGGSRSGGKKKRNPRGLANPLSLREVNQRISAFVQQHHLAVSPMCGADSCVELKFQLVSRAMCRTIAALAKAYNLTCLIEESKRRLPVASPRLRVTPQTKMAAKEELEPILRQHGKTEGAVYTRNGRGSSSHQVGTNWNSSGRSHRVGSGSHAIDDTNIGNQMLQGMGWSPGSGLGRNCDGIRSPVKAYVRARHAGLGFS